MKIKSSITEFSLKHYKMVTWIMVLVTIVLGALIPLIKVDTDPENMLAEDEPVRVFHNEVKDRFDLSDIVVVGVVNEQHPEGVFNPESLQRIYEITQFAEGLRWDDPSGEKKFEGVIEVDMIAPSLVDHIGQGGVGVVKFEWLMPSPPQTVEQAKEIREKAMNNPLLKGTMVSEDGKAIAIYLPLTSKDLSYRVYRELQKEIETFSGDDQFHITGLPVAEDTFGVEMFIQMAISAPLAMLTIFILMLIFFRKLVLVISPMIVAMVSVITTMGLMIGLGYPVHIMSSMIPIFLMPIAVVDSVHILSEFFDLYTKQKGRRQSIREVMDNLFVPMLYTSLTSAAGFASLSLTPIPPVQVFGVFVAIGIMVAWLCTVTFVPAYIMMISDKRLENFGMAAHHEDSDSPLSKLLHAAGRLTYRWAKPILAVIVVLTGIAVYGITRIQINDNPVKWFAQGHPIRVADNVLNEHFAGTYMAYLVLSGPEQLQADQQYIQQLKESFEQYANEIRGDYDNFDKYSATVKGFIEDAQSEADAEKYLDGIISKIEKQMQGAPDDKYFSMDDMIAFFSVEKERLKVFKRPEVLRFMDDLQNYLVDLEVVGKVNSVADIVKKVNQELRSGEKKDYEIPDELRGVAETLLQFQGSHRPGDLWHFVTPDYKNANLWLQLSSGDNKDMQKVTDAVDDYFAKHQPPVNIEHDWAGLTYINVVWQDKMVWGMLQSFIGSFLVVFIMMSILFRSPLWGIICMVPLTITIAMIYGIIGLVGKDYDMPVAVLSALTLGMAVDFAIHFLQRSRDSFAKTDSWKESSAEMFGEPARAISRNVLVIAIGFLPLLAAPLVPYKTVGIFLCAIMGLSGAVTIIALPAIIRLAEKALFRHKAKVQSPTCNCGFCIIISIAITVLVLLNLHQYWQMGVSTLTWVSAVAIPAMALGCGIISRRKACNRMESTQKSENQEQEKGDKQ